MNDVYQKDSNTKIATTFQHGGLAYSPERRGMLVVDNNAVGQKPIKVNLSRNCSNLESKLVKDQIVSQSPYEFH